MVIQFLLLAILIAALLLTWRRTKQNALSRRAAILWSLLWIAGGIVVMLPDVANLFANLVGVGRGADAILYVSVLLIVYLLFRVFLRLDRMERDLTKLVRRIALDEMQKK